MGYTYSLLVSGSKPYDGAPMAISVISMPSGGVTLGPESLPLTLSPSAYSVQYIGLSTAPSARGSYSVKITITTDSYRHTSGETVTQTLNITEGAPIITAGQTASGKVGTAFSFSPALTDSANRPVTSWSATGLPSWASINTSTGAITPSAGEGDKILAIAAGASHYLALKYDGTVVALGSNSAGQTTIPSGLSGVTAIAVGSLHSLALKNDGTVVAWGLESSAQTTIPYGLSGVTAIAVGKYHSLALKNDGTVVAWGSNSAGQTTIPSGLSGVTAIAGVDNHSLALKSDGTVVAWGEGQTTIPSGLSGVTAIAVGTYHSLALKNDGTVVAWGDNSYGQTTIPSGLSGVTAIAVGSLHSLALKNDGTVVAWGLESSAQTTIPSGLSAVVSIAAASNYSLALKNDGTVVAWGRNSEGQTIIPFFWTIPQGSQGQTTITLTATGPGGTDTETAVISIAVGPPIITAGQSFSSKVGEAFVQSIALEDALDQPATSWTRTSGTIPAGLTLNASTGAISGTPTAKGSFTASFTATGGGGTSSATSVSFTIAEGAPIITAGQTASGKVGTSFSFSPALTDSANRPVTSWSATGLPVGLAIDTMPDTTASWLQRGIDIGAEAAGDQSGYSVSMNAAGNVVAIGAPDNDASGNNSGHVRIYAWNGSVWVQRGVDIDGEAAGDQSGNSVSLNAEGDIVAIGAYTNKGNGSDSGHVRVYAWNGSVWVQRGIDIDGEAAGDLSGYSVSLNAEGDVVAIGAYTNDGNGSNSGHVRVYAWNGSVWVQRGVDIDGEAAGDQSGYSVSMNAAGDVVAIGAINNDGNGSNSGHVRVYAWNGSVWVQRGVDIDGEAAGDLSGYSVSMNAAGDVIAIGAIWADDANANYFNGTGPGHVRIYAWNGSVWVQRGIDIKGEAEGDDFGYSVSLNAAGNVVAIGAPGNDNSGHVRIYAWNGSAWTQRGIDIDGNGAALYFGSSVSLNATGDVVAVGDRNFTGYVRIYAATGLSYAITGTPLVGSQGQTTITLTATGPGGTDTETVVFSISADAVIEVAFVGEGALEPVLKKDALVAFSGAGAALMEAGASWNLYREIGQPAFAGVTAWGGAPGVSEPGFVLIELTRFVWGELEMPVGFKGRVGIFCYTTHNGRLTPEPLVQVGMRFWEAAGVERLIYRAAFTAEGRPFDYVAVRDGESVIEDELVLEEGRSYGVYNIWATEDLPPGDVRVHFGVTLKREV